MRLSEWLKADPVNHVIHVYAEEHPENPEVPQIIAAAIEFPNSPDQKLVMLRSETTPDLAVGDLAFYFSHGEKAGIYNPKTTDWTENSLLRFIATDECGCAFGYTERPTQVRDGWLAKVFYSLRVCTANDSDIVYDWKNSLIERPEGI